MASGYYKIPVAYISGSLPTHLETLTVQFSRTGDMGATGFQGSTGATGYQGGTGATGTGSVGATPNTIMQRDGNADVFARIFNGTATSAYYADLAEKYLADADYPVGTVMTVGGIKEVTAVTTSDCYVIGVVSDKPAYMMNAELVNGTFIALVGRVPVRVEGTIIKGDPVYPFVDGKASNVSNGKEPFGFALADGGPGLVECVIK